MRHAKFNSIFSDSSVATTNEMTFVSDEIKWFAWVGIMGEKRNAIYYLLQFIRLADFQMQSESIKLAADIQSSPEKNPLQVRIHYQVTAIHNNLVNAECYATHLLLIIVRYAHSTKRLMKFIKCNTMYVCAHILTHVLNILCTIPHPIKVHKLSLSGRILNPSSCKIRFFRLCFACDVKWLTGFTRKGQQKGWLQSQILFN